MDNEIMKPLAAELERGLDDILSRGGCVFPICSDSKMPLPLPGKRIGKPGMGGYKLATNDPRIVWHYFRGDPLPDDMPAVALKTLAAWRRTDQPNAAVALDMSGMLVLDVDDLDELVAFTAKCGKLPSTYCVRSPRARGGLHYYFKAFENVSYRRTLEGFPHLDIKHHGYVLIPGSVKRNESKEIIGRYSVVDDSPIADMPEWLLTMLERQPVPVAERRTVESEWGAVGDLDIQRARRYLAKMPPAISGSGGHNATFAAACALVRGFALSEDDAYNILASDYNPRCEPPWTEWELRHKVRSAMENGTAAMGYLLYANEPRCQGSEEDTSYKIEPLWNESCDDAGNDDWWNA